MKRFLVRLTVIPIAVVLCLATGCVSRWRQDMRALEAEELKPLQWPGLKLVGLHQTEEDGFKSPTPQIVRCYRSTIPDEQAFALVLRAAEEQGWTEDKFVSTPQSRIAHKHTKNGSLQLTITSHQPGCEQYRLANFRISHIYG